VVIDQVQDELDALAVRLGRSLTIDGVNGDLVAYSTQRDDADAARISSILLRHVAADVREWEERHVSSMLVARSSFRRTRRSACRLGCVCRYDDTIDASATSGCSGRTTNSLRLSSPRSSWQPE
jgi:hypothetical protein